jgi:hypothetical protein
MVRSVVSKVMWVGSATVFLVGHHDRYAKLPIAVTLLKPWDKEERRRMYASN